MLDYSKLVMVMNGVISFEPVPASLYGLTNEQLGDDSIMAQYDYIALGMRWFQPVDYSVPLQKYQSYTGEAVLTWDTEKREVHSVRSVRTWTAEEITAWKAAQYVPVSYFDYRMRLTADERAAIELASLDAPASTVLERLAAAKIRVFERDMSLAVTINLNAPWVHEGLAMYEAAGLIAAGRSSFIIWGDEEP